MILRGESRLPFLLYGQKNIISVMIFMDEKRPYMHFLFGPATPDGRLNVNAIYTWESLRRLQGNMPEYLQKGDFRIERGAE